MAGNAGWTAKSRGNALGYGIFKFFIKHFGLRFAYANLTYVIIYFIIFAPSSRNALWHYYRRQLHYGRLQAMGALYMHFFRFGQCIIDKMAAKAGLTSSLSFSMENYETFQEILNSGQGALLIGAHVGAWEMGAPFFGEYGKKIHIVMWDAEWQKIKDVIEADSNGNNYNVIPINKDSIEAILSIKKALDDGGLVCMQGDRYIDEEHRTEVDFLGGKADFPDGPFLLGAKMKMPVVFYFAMREKMSYRFIFHVANVEGRPGTKEYQHALLQEYATELENIVRRYPRQWFNLYEFWKR